MHGWYVPENMENAMLGRWSGYSGRWAEVPDMTLCTTRDEVVRLAVDTYKGRSDAAVANSAGSSGRSGRGSNRMI